MDERTICVNLFLFVAQYIAWALSLIASFTGGVVFWSRYAKYNNVAGEQQPQIAQTPTTPGRRVRSA